MASYSLIILTHTEGQREIDLQNRQKNSIRMSTEVHTRRDMIRRREGPAIS